MTFNTTVLMKSVVGTVLATAAVALLQMWFHIFDALIFWKLLVTLVVVGVSISLVIALKQDLGDEKKMKDDKYVD